MPAASLNVAQGPRVGITTYWSAPFLRQLLNFPYGLRPEVAAELGIEWARPGAENSGVLGRQSSQ